jgi:hypothetical protein
MSWDRLRLPQKFTSVINGQGPHQLVMWVPSGSIGMWTVQVLFYRDDRMYLNNCWRHFVHAHAVVVRHFLIFKFDGHCMLTVKVIDEVMCRCHYYSDEDDHARVR